MKRTALGLVIGAFFASAAQAAPPALPLGPVYLKYNNVEAIGPATAANPTGTITSPSGTMVQNFGIADFKTIAAGDPFTVTPHVTFGQGTTSWTDLSGGEVTAIFWGVQALSGAGTIPVGGLDPNAGTRAVGGYVDFWWDTTDEAVAGGHSLGSYNAATFANGGDWGRPGSTTVPVAGPDNGMADAAGNSVSDGTFLMRLQFMPGCDNGLNPLTAANAALYTVCSTADISNPAFGEGNTVVYADVADVNGDGFITAADGAWAQQLNTDWFFTNPGGGPLATRDVYFSNHFTAALGIPNNWNDPGIYFGATSDDPMRAFAQNVPEIDATAGAGALTMLGGMMALVADRRRRRQV
jgi:hypothetical protein